LGRIGIWGKKKLVGKESAICPDKAFFENGGKKPELEMDNAKRRPCRTPPPGKKDTIHQKGKCRGGREGKSAHKKATIRSSRKLDGKLIQRGESGVEKVLSIWQGSCAFCRIRMEEKRGRPSVGGKKKREISDARFFPTRKTGQNRIHRRKVSKRTKRGKADPY